jgi:hypothetical protein
MLRTRDREGVEREESRPGQSVFPSNEEKMEVIDALMQQFTEEIGDAEVSSRENQALRMKYGLSNITLVPSEKYLILKEEREYRERT